MRSRPIGAGRVRLGSTDLRHSPAGSGNGRGGATACRARHAARVGGSAALPNWCPTSRTAAWPRVPSPAAEPKAAEPRRARAGAIGRQSRSAGVRTRHAHRVAARRTGRLRPDRRRERERGDHRHTGQKMFHAAILSLGFSIGDCQSDDRFGSRLGWLSPYGVRNSFCGVGVIIDHWSGLKAPAINNAPTAEPPNGTFI